MKKQNKEKPAKKLFEKSARALQACNGDNEALGGNLRLTKQDRGKVGARQDQGSKFESSRICQSERLAKT